MQKSIIFTLQFIAFLFSPMALASESLCKSDEKIVFSCPVGHAKTVSVCASKSLTNGGYIQYRFGRENHIELSIPTDGKLKQYAKFVEGNQSGPTSNSRSFIRFKRGRYSYAVYDFLYQPASLNSGGCDTESGLCDGDGVIVENSGSVISRLNCQGLYGHDITNFIDDYLKQLDIPSSDDWPKY